MSEPKIENVEKSEVEEEDEEDGKGAENLEATNTSNDSAQNGQKKKRKFKPRKFISKMNLKIKGDDKKVAKNGEDEEQQSKEGEEKVATVVKSESFRQNFVKRFSRGKKYKVSPLSSTENNAVKNDVEEEPLNNEKEILEISKSDPNLSNSVEAVVVSKMNEDSLELSKSMQTVDKSVYTTTTREITTSSSSVTKENKKVQLQITISGKKIEKVNTPNASEITTTQTIVNGNEVDKASPLQQQQQQQKSRTDIILPSTSTTVRVSTSSSDEVFNVMVPRNASGGSDSNAYSQVVQQAKTISKPSVTYSTVVQEGLNGTSSVSEREIEKYLVLTSNLNTIISAAKDLDNVNSDAEKLQQQKAKLDFPPNITELKIIEEQEKALNNLKISNLEKEKQLIESEIEMKKSRIPVNTQRRSSSNDVVEKPPSPVTTVHTQEAHQPYNLNLSTSISTEDLEETAGNVVEDAKQSPSSKPPPTPSSPPPVSELKVEDIKFELGTSVRPPKILQSTPIGAIADIVITDTEFPSSSIKENETSDEAFHSPISESSITVAKRDPKTRRKIAYIPELSVYTAEEQELLKSNITANHFYSESFDIPSLPPDSSIFPVFEENAVNSMTPSTPEKRECLYKILVIGELGTGKTSFIKRYVHQFFSQNYRATIGVDFALKVLSWDESTIIRLQLWDIAGQERFGNMTRVYYKEAVGAFIVFDVTRTPTFDAVNKWKQDLDSKVQLPDGSPIPCILLANKCDQQKQGLVTMPAKMDEYCRQNGFAGWFETSAKDNTNIEESAKALVSKILLNDKLIHNDMLDGDRLVLDAEDPNKPKKFCSC